MDATKQYDSTVRQPAFRLAGWLGALFLTLALTLVPHSPLSAQDKGFGSANFSLGGSTMAFGGNSEDHATVRLVSDKTAVVPGAALRVGVEVELADDWHIYGRESGDVGEPTRVEWGIPEGWTVGDTQFPTPKEDRMELVGETIVSYLYEHEVLLWAEATPPAELTPGAEITFGATIHYMLCKTDGMCLPPASKEVTLTLAVAETAEATEHAERFIGPEPGGTSPVGGPFELQDVADQSLWMALLKGLLAGLILNVMPCVLPVISIKVLTMVRQAGEHPKRIFQLGMAFSAGILVVFLGLAALTAYFGATWGSQFQSRGFLVAMIGVIFVFSMAMFGVWEFGLPGALSNVGAKEEGESLLSSFGLGIMATVLATPCSGPFLGAILAYAMRQPPRIIFAIFASIGVGMALPYMLLSIRPTWVRFLPRPGAWMERFKQIMGFVLLGTAVYLLGILPSDWMLWTVVFCLGLGIASFVWGQMTTLADPRSKHLMVRVIAILIGVFSGWLSFGYFLPATTGQSTTHMLDWEPFSPQRLEQELAEGRTVLIDFTADWCPNCKFNEAFALNTEETKKFVETHGIIPLKADWTDRNEEIRLMLERLDSVSVPLTAIFPADRPTQPIVLRDTFRKSTLLEKLNEAVTTESNSE
ncbi:MAG: thioredoxin family protein [Verrucomicrobiota bacterium]|nr:thioredoxin family protein [Verrucomicrobiota bacterium]MDD8045416.1 thioredoxin family protein [Verrucomicrobiota bacterium]